VEYRVVVFDLDGTLLDTLQDLADSMNAALAHLGFPTHDVDAYRYFVGEGAGVMAQRALPDDRDDDNTVRRCLAAMREEYSKRWRDKTRPYPGIPRLLDRLMELEVRLTVLSNKPDDFTKLMVAELLPEWRFDLVLGQREGIARKPDPAGAFEIARELGIACEAFAYLGDSGTDMITASGAGMLAVGALWGFRTEDELRGNGAKFVIHRPEELLSIVSPGES